MTTLVVSPTSGGSSGLVMSDVIDETLDYIHRYMERPSRIVVGSEALVSASDTTFTLSTGVASISDVVEFDQELMLVTGKTSDATPVYTVARNYLGTVSAGEVATNDFGWVNPMYPRYQVQRAIERSFITLNKFLPNIVSEVYLRVPSKQYAILPDNTIDVLEVGYFPQGVEFLGEADTFRYTEIGGWAFIQDLPTALVPGKILRVPRWVPDDLELVVKRRAPYVWSDSPVQESSTISLPVPADDVPVLFAAARLVAGREISRSELDRVEEWNQEAAIRGGVNLRLLQGLWADFYHRLDEVRSLQYVPKHRPYRKMRHLPVRQPVWLR